MHLVRNSGDLAAVDDPVSKIEWRKPLWEQMDARCVLCLARNHDSNLQILADGVALRLIIPHEILFVLLEEK